MRLLIVCHEYPPLRGGAGVGVRHLAERFARLGHETEVVTAGPVAGTTTEGGVRVRRLPWRSRPGQLGSLGLWLVFLRRGTAAVRQAAATLRPHVVLSFFPTVAGLAVARAGCTAPHVTTFVGADIHDPTRRVSADRNLLARWLVSAAVRDAAAVVAISSEMAHRVETVFPGRTVERICLGVPPLSLSALVRPDRPTLQHGIVVATACRLVRRKRVDVLIDALAHLAEPAVRAVILGDGPEKSRLVDQAMRLGIAGRVRFAGWVDEATKTAELAAADVYCQPSEHEALGLAIVEAMSLSTAVITSDVGGQTDVVREGREGFLVPVGDATSVAGRLHDLASDPELLRRLQRAAAQRAQEFTPERTADEFLRLLDRVLAASARGKPHEEKLPPDAKGPGRSELGEW